MILLRVENSTHLAASFLPGTFAAINLQVNASEIQSYLTMHPRRIDVLESTIGNLGE